MLALIVTTIFLLNQVFIILSCECMSTTVHVNGTVQITFFWVMRLNITIVISCDSLVVIFVS